MSDPLHIGVTGTRHPTTDFQQRRMLELLAFFKRQLNWDWGASVLHHGDCTGADSLAHNLAIRVDIEHIVIHPPIDSKHRAFCHRWDIKPKVTTLEEPKPYLSRNHDIVNASNLLIAVPKSEEIQRSGTWSTVRYARQNQMVIYLLYPFRVETENDPFDWRPTEPFQSPWTR